MVKTHEQYNVSYQPYGTESLIEAPFAQDGDNVDLSKAKKLEPSNKDTKPKRICPGYSFKAEINSNLVDELYQNIINEVEQLHDPSAEQRMQWALFFSICSGVGFVELIDALFHILKTVERPFQKVGPFMIIPINYSKGSHFNNIVENDNRTNQRLFFPDPMATAAISAFVKVKDQLSTEHTSAEKELGELFKRVSPKSTFINLSLKHQLKAIAAWVFRQPGTELVMWQRGFMEGTEQSASMSINSLTAQLNHKINKTQIKHLNVQAVAKQTTEKNKVCATRINSYNRDELLNTLRILINDPKQTLKAFCQKLNDLTQQGLTSPQQVLVAWILHNFESKKWKKKSSAKRHLSALGESWLDNTARLQLESLDISDITHLYEQILEERKTNDTKVVASLFCIIKFMSGYLGTPMPDCFAQGQQGFVRTTLISETHFQRLLVDVIKTFNDASDHEKQCILVSLILIRRLGLRPHEADLYLSDVVIGKVNSITIHRNLKSSSAHRILKPELFMVGDEFQFFCTFVNMRKHQARGANNQPIFTLDPRGSSTIDFQKLASVCSQLLAQYLGEPTPLYQLRHSALSILQIILFGDEELVKVFTPYSIKQANHIKLEMHQGRQQDLLYQLSSYAGHLSQRISLSTYCHFSDILLYQQLKKTKRKFSQTFWCRLLKIRESTWRKFHGSKHSHRSQVNVSPLEAEKCVHHYACNINPLTRIALGAKDMESVILKGFKLPTPTLADLDTILRTHDDSLELSPEKIKQNVDDVTDALGLEKLWGTLIVEVAREVKANKTYETSKGKSRLYPSNGPRLAPPTPRSAAEINDAEKIEQKLAKLDFEQQKQVRIASNILFKQSTHGHSEIIFQTPEQIKDFLIGVRLLIPDNRWFIILNPLDKKNKNEQLSFWRENCDFANEVRSNIAQTVTDERYHPNGRLNLYFQRVVSNKMVISLKNVEKQSSNALKYVLHLHAILRGAERKYRQLEAERNQEPIISE